ATAPGDNAASPWDNVSGAIGFRANAPARITQSVVVDGQPHLARLLNDDDHPMTRLIGLSANRVIAFENGAAFDVSAFGRTGSGTGGPASDGALRAPMPGKIVATPAKPGDSVTRGQPVVVLEAMKMEHALVAPFDGVVDEIGVSVGDQVAADAVLAVVTAAD
ncbi:MAG: biotin/lipoyl-containing protein, partial [Brevundimonas sp.]|nr:biotin/lipoyl-containing protein [Brevundimonas sp.]